MKDSGRLATKWICCSDRMPVCLPQPHLVSISSDFGIKQAFIALRAPIGNGLDFKLGVWDTIIGYEVFESPNNPNYSRSYGWGFEPTTHTGLLASYRITDNVSVAAGIANSRGPTINGRTTYFNYPGETKS